MIPPYDILMQKTVRGVTSVQSLYHDFGFVSIDNLWPDIQVKELATRDWPGVSGEDVYIPRGLPLKPFDWTAEVVYKGSEAMAKWDNLCNYLVGLGSVAEMNIYDTLTDYGYVGVYVSKIERAEYDSTAGEEVIVGKITFRITNPSKKTMLSYVGN